MHLLQKTLNARYEMTLRNIRESKVDFGMIVGCVLYCWIHKEGGFHDAFANSFVKLPM